MCKIFTEADPGKGRGRVQNNKEILFANVCVEHTSTFTRLSTEVCSNAVQLGLENLMQAELAL